jgi:hypothetical protein
MRSVARPRSQTGRCDATDPTWGRCQERAAEAFVSGDGDAPHHPWARTLQIAEERFARRDPKLATNLVDQALVLRRLGQVRQARQVFDDALQVLGPR